MKRAKFHVARSFGKGRVEIICNMKWETKFGENLNNAVEGKSRQLGSVGRAELGKYYGALCMMKEKKSPRFIISQSGPK